MIAKGEQSHTETTEVRTSISEDYCFAPAQKVPRRRLEALPKNQDHLPRLVSMQTSVRLAFLDAPKSLLELGYQPVYVPIGFIMLTG